jgi:hypothetical protein
MSIEALSKQVQILTAENERLRTAGLHVHLNLPEGWHAVPEHATDKMIVAASKGSSTADKFRRMIYAAPKLA